MPKVSSSGREYQTEHPAPIKHGPIKPTLSHDDYASPSRPRQRLSTQTRFHSQIAWSVRPPTFCLCEILKPATTPSRNGHHDVAPRRRELTKLPGPECCLPRFRAKLSPYPHSTPPAPRFRGLPVGLERLLGGNVRRIAALLFRDGYACGGNCHMNGDITMRCSTVASGL
jgi:hypothetical protein